LSKRTKNVDCSSTEKKKGERTLKSRLFDTHYWDSEALERYKTNIASAVACRNWMHL